MRYLLMLSIFISQIGMALPAETIQQINKKLGGIVYKPGAEIEVRKVFEGGPLFQAGLNQGQLILEIDNQVVYSLDQFYYMIAAKEGPTSLLVENKELGLETAMIYLGPAITITPREEPTRGLSGQWKGTESMTFNVAKPTGDCTKGDKRENYTYESTYAAGVSSFGRIIRNCRTNRLEVFSDRYGFKVRGRLENSKYMIWYKVPILSRTYDFHLWR
ncbi:MAG: hypothetical protein CMP10_05185 [Zetaproteobacteria bacterium]|nr:hypothetical protein [Pseudobdellovibrionaceae bacterium]